MLQNVANSCRLLQTIPGCWRLLQNVEDSCKILQAAADWDRLFHTAVADYLIQTVEDFWIMLQNVADSSLLNVFSPSPCKAAAKEESIITANLLPSSLLPSSKCRETNGFLLLGPLGKPHLTKHSRQVGYFRNFTNCSWTFNNNNLVIVSTDPNMWASF